MGDTKMREEHKKKEINKVDTKEFELPDTLFVRDIENSVFQGIVFQCLSKIEGISPVEGNFMEHIFGRGAIETPKGISIEQDNKHHSVGVKIEVNILYGYSIPEKAEEIQGLCSEEITRLTGLHVSSVHVVFKNMLLENQLVTGTALSPPALLGSNLEEEYNDEF